jgi:quinoprotein glucose dehydrogenase
MGVVVSTYKASRALLLSLFAVALCAISPQSRAQEPIFADPPPKPQEVYFWTPPDIRLEDYVTGLDRVGDLLFLPDGRLLVYENSGQIRVVTADGSLQAEPWAVPRDAFGELAGLALHPHFSEQPWVYMLAVFRKNGGHVNRVIRFRDGGAHGIDQQVVLDDLPASERYNGGRIAFGPDGNLYVALGDAGEHARAPQDRADLRGKILRITAEGDVPAGNPWPDSPVWALGFRNPHGLAFHPATALLFSADHGPDGGRDQLDIVQGGKNYGWPLIFGAARIAGFEDPILEWTPAMPPGGMAFYNAGLLPQLKGDLFITTLRAEALLRIQFKDSQNPTRPTAIERWFVSEDLGSVPMGQGRSALGRLRAITVGPDGAIYIGTSNRDTGRGRIRMGDDRVVRLVPSR